MDIKKAIRALLQSKFGGVQLSDARVEQLVKQLDGKVTTEDELSQKMEALNELLPFSDIAKEDDRQRTLAAELEKLKSKKQVTEEKKEEEEKREGGEEIPSWAKALIDGNKAVTEKLAALEGQKIVNDRKSAILAKLKDADEAYANKVFRDFSRMSFQDDASFEEYLGDVEADFTAHAQAQAESKLGKDAPYFGTGAGGKNKEASKEELDAVMDTITI